MVKTFQLTEDGVRELKKELAELVDSRPKMAEQIKVARDFGDLSENAEYQSAREAQDKAEARIEEIEAILANFEVINKSGTASQVELGSHVVLESDGKSKELQVVGTVEADPMSGKISNESPIGQALLGKKLGDAVAIAASPEAAYKITKIY